MEDTHTLKVSASYYNNKPVMLPLGGCAGEGDKEGINGARRRNSAGHRKNL